MVIHINCVRKNVYTKNVTPYSNLGEKYITGQKCVRCHLLVLHSDSISTVSQSNIYYSRMCKWECSWKLGIVSYQSYVDGDEIGLWNGLLEPSDVAVSPRGFYWTVE
jgi:hypothetical protein